MTETRDVVVVGAGILGCVAARELATDHDVLVLDRGTVAGGATGKASGLVTIVEEYSDVPAAARHAIEFFRELDGTGDFAFEERPYVELRSGEHDPVDLRAHAADVRDAGFDSAFLTPGELEGRFPGTFRLDGHVGGVVHEDAGWLDPYTCAMTVKNEAEADGATFRTGVQVRDVLVDGDADGPGESVDDGRGVSVDDGRDENVDDGHVVGVETDAGRVEAETVVVAAGWRTRDLVADLVELPTRPYRYQTYNLEPGRGFDEEFPMAWDEYSHLYWRPEHNGELHVGGGTYFVREPGTVRTNTTEGFRRLVARTIPERLVGLEDARFVAGDTCRTGDAATPDRYPVLDTPAEAPDGLVVATGMHGFGIMASPVAGSAVRALVTGEDAPFPLEPFRLARFDDRSPAFDSSYISESPEGVGPAD